MLHEDLGRLENADQAKILSYVGLFKQFISMDVRQIITNCFSSIYQARNVDSMQCKYS